VRGFRSTKTPKYFGEKIFFPTIYHYGVTSMRNIPITAPKFIGNAKNGFFPKMSQKGVTSARYILSKCDAVFRIRGYLHWLSRAIHLRVMADNKP